MASKSAKRKPAVRKERTMAGRILLIDSHLLDLETYADVLGHFGHEVRVCASYSEAEHVLDSGGFDLVIVGQSGPQFEGRAVLERLHSEGDRIPSLVLAKNNDVDLRLEAMSLGAADYISKPVSPQRLKHAVEACLVSQASAVGCD